MACPKCGFDTMIDDTGRGHVFCENCGYIMRQYDPVMDAEFDGMAVRWEDLDHSHDNEVKP